MLPRGFATAFQRASANAEASDMADVAAVALYETRSCAHRYDDGLVQSRFKTGPQAIGNKLVDLLCGDAVDRAVDIAGTHASQHHLLHIAQLNLIVVQVFAEGPIE